ncbi:hypothetical protein GETHLI_30770 [Geothrix limicola]|uniref:Flagellar motor switch protein FliG n=1 Tax=Geothrix limicola TaxID=2927978 RepID=A0ABQ5QI97_9BACT|nr:hypothetical protein [Geothrix limicola]GLH74575.1 hypothetical protein GETHLI_30770 [Geothrix limicola]
MSTHPIVEKFVQGKLPEPMAMALVGGSLPVPAKDLLNALAFAVLRETPYTQRALDFLATMPESMVAGVVTEPVDPPEILQLVLCHRKEPALLETALLNPSLTSEIVEASVLSLPGTVLEIVLNNQVLWLERPRILDLLEEHPEGEYVIKRRVNEFRFDILRLIPEDVKKQRLEIIDEVEAGRLDRAWSELPLPKEKSKEEADAEVESDEMAAERRLLAQKPPVDDEGNEITLTLTQRVMKLSTNQKIMLAIKGGKEERTLLIREANRLIQVNVIRNGRITEGEIAYIAQMRTVNEEVLRIISNSREWMKKYPITKALVMNPRTPLPVAMTHFKRLFDADMKLLIKDRNVPELLRREAKRLVEMKEKGKN